MNLKSGYPFSLVKYGLPFSYPSLECAAKTEVAIMGGGISGALVAYYLVNAGIDCLLIDARTIGLGSTCASTSLLQYEIDTPLSELIPLVGKANAVRAYELCAESINILGKIAAKIGFTDYHFKKSLYYAAYKKDTAFLKEEYAARHKYGFKVAYLNDELIKQEFNFNAPGAILSELAAQTNAYLLTHSLLQAAIKKGLRVFDRSAATLINHSKTGVKITTEKGHVLRSKKLVYANGYEAVNYIDKKIVDLHSTYACVSDQANVKETFGKDDALMWSTADPYLYMRTTGDSRILVGGRDEQFYNPVKRDKLLPAKTMQLAADFNRLFPEITFKPEFSWTGTFGATKDGLPFIGTYNKLPNSYFALGFGGNGITFSVIAAQLLRDLITGKKNKDTAIFSFDRV